MGSKASFAPLRSLVKASQNILLFDERAAVEFLQGLGYRVVKEDYPVAENITTVSQLVGFFYRARAHYNPNRKFPESIDSTKDRNFVGGFVQSRQKLGLNRKTAIRESAQLIDALFKYEELLGLETPVMSPRILGVRSIMDRVCSFLNGEVKEACEMDTELLIKEYNQYYNTNFANEDLQIADKKRQEILENLNGKR